MSKLISSKCINKTGWKAKVNLEEGLYKTYKDFLKIMHVLKKLIFLLTY